MGALIDTSILINAERGLIVLGDHIGSSDDDFFLSVICASELLHGVHRAVESKVRNQRAAFVEGILQRFPILPIDLSVARAHSRIWAELSSAGEMIGAHDLWLAATCLAHGLRIITGNTREFERVAGLTVEVWS